MTATTEDPRQRLILALDVDDRTQARDMVRRTVASVGIYKVGLQLFVAEGPDLVRELVAEGARVFLDLKLHDIPHQVRGAARSAAYLGADMLTVHTSGGAPMMVEALAGAREGAHEASRDISPLVIGVTVLTSMDRDTLMSVGVAEGEVADQVTRLAGLAADAGLDGVVASPLEAASLRGLLGPEACIVTPGIRPAGSAIGDQSRVATPASALRAGASHLVIGRPITQAPDAVAAFEDIVAEMSEDGCR